MPSALPFEDSRRLTGANLFFGRTGAVLETTGLEVDDALLDGWRRRVERARAHLGWPRDPAAVARVHVRRGAQASLLPQRARRELRGALLRVDDESVALLRYFDAYLLPLDDVSAASGRRLLAVLERALGDAPAAS